MRNEFIRTHDFSQYNVSDISDLIGKELVLDLREIFDNERNIIKWFYSPSLDFNSVSPYEFYKNNINADQELKRVVTLMKYGEFGAL